MVELEELDLPSFQGRQLPPAEGPCRSARVRLCGSLTEFLLQKHIKEHHEEVRERPCPHPGCNKVFMIDRYLQRHVKLIHTGTAVVSVTRVVTARGT